MADTPRPMGALGSSFGVKGWMKVRSFTSQPENLFDYSPWFIRQRGMEWREVQVEEYKPHGNDFIVKLNVASTPEEAKAVIEEKVFIYEKNFLSDVNIINCSLEYSQSDTGIDCIVRYTLEGEIGMKKDIWAK